MTNAQETEVTRQASVWQAMMEHHESQASRVREYPGAYDHWASLTRLFEPGAVTPDVEAVLNLVEPGETWMDTGAGAGRITIPVAGKAGRVVANDSSAGMTERLREIAAERGIENLRVLPAAPWPLLDLPEPVDVVFSAHVLYFVHQVMPFIEAMEKHARRMCVVLLGDEAGSLPPYDAWKAAHGENMVRLPALGEFESLMQARGIRYELTEIPLVTAPPQDLTDLLHVLMRRCLVREDSDKAAKLQAWFEEQHASTGAPPPMMAMQRMALIRWAPPAK